MLYTKAGKIYARFEGLGTQKVSKKNVLLKKKVTLDEDVEALEVCVQVGKKADLIIDSYSLRPIDINTEKK